MDGGSLKCPGCGQPVRVQDEFCQACGAKVPEEMRAQPETAPRPRRSTRGARAARSRSRQVKKAAAWILILGILFAIFGTIFGFMTKAEADKVLTVLASYEDGEILLIEDETRTVVEWREAIEREVMLVFLTNYFLAAIMIGIHFWARKNAFPAIVTAFSVFLAVQLLNLMIDPKTLAQGIIIKVIVIVVFIGGIQAALAERAAARRSAAGPDARRSARARRG